MKFNGEQFDPIPTDKLTPAEVDAVERVTGMTLPAIRRAGDTCVCGHGSKDHEHKDEQGEQTDDTACTVCSCPEHSADVRMSVNTAFMWVAIKRTQPTVTFAQVQATPMVSFTDDDDEPAPVDADPSD